VGIITEFLLALVLMLMLVLVLVLVLVLLREVRSLDGQDRMIRGGILW
jgi:hypothetical protein